MSDYFLTLTHEDEFDNEPDFYQMLDLREENERLRKALREVLKFVPCARVCQIGRDALGEPAPPLRKLTNPKKNPK